MASRTAGSRSRCTTPAARTRCTAPGTVPGHHLGRVDRVRGARRPSQGRTRLQRTPLRHPLPARTCAELTGDVLDGWPKHAADRPQGTAPSWSPVEAHGSGRHEADLLRHQHRPTGRSPNSSSVTAAGPRGGRIRAARATGLRNLPLKRTVQNRRLEIVQIALDLLAWMPMLVLTGKARLREPAACGFACSPQPDSSSPPAVGGSFDWPATGPWTSHITAALERLARQLTPG